MSAVTNVDHAKHFCSCMPKPSPVDILMRKNRQTSDRAVFLTNVAWKAGDKIAISFLNGTSAQKKHVKNVAQTWLKYANLKFVWKTGPAAALQSDVRITFNTDEGSWSYMGTQARSIPKNEATMNFGWLPQRPQPSDRGTILHEFGHMLGLGHEHQNPNKGLTWRREVVIEALSGEPNYWSLDSIESNVLSRYSANDSEIVATNFDPDSIMLYFFPATWNAEGFETRENHKLSAKDKANIAAMYPHEDDKWEIDSSGSDSEIDMEEDSDDDLDDMQVGCFNQLTQMFKKVQRAFLQ